MEVISQETVDRAWREVGAFSPARMQRYVARLGIDQPNLLAFMTAFTQDLKEDAQGVGLYVLAVVHRMFELHAPRPLKRISARRIEDTFEALGEFLDKVDRAHEAFLGRIAETQIAAQPFVMKYVVEALMEVSEDAEALSSEDEGYLFMLLKTVVDVLDKAG
jgi:hypothetical protein